MDINISQFILQNDIWMVKMGTAGIVGHEQKGNRPFYVISKSDYNKNSKTPIGFFLSTSTKKQQNRFTVDVDMQGTNETVNVSQIRTISSDRFISKMGTGTNQDTQKLLATFIKELI